MDLHYLLLVSKELEDSDILNHISKLRTELKKLKTTRINNESVYLLPDPINKIPTLIKNKPKTRWQKFAEAKHIKKRKGRLVYDGEEFVERYGPRSKKNNFEVIEESKFLKMMKKKMKDIEKNKTNQMKNKANKRKSGKK